MYKYFLPSSLNTTIQYDTGVEKLDFRNVISNLSVTSDATHAKLSFPSGLEIETNLTNKGAHVISNWPIVTIKDGSYHFAKPYPELD